MKVSVFEAYLIISLEESDEDNGIWRPDLAKNIDSPDATIFDHLKILKEKELVDNYKFKKNLKGRGRARVLWYLTDKGKMALKVIQRGMQQ